MDIVYLYIRDEYFLIVPSPLSLQLIALIGGRLHDLRAKLKTDLLSTYGWR